jgi:hypothetical protein
MTLTDTVHRIRTLVLSVALTTHLSVLAGEPLLTDDPGTPGPNTWELNAAVILADFENSTAWEIPSVSLAYGIGERIEVGAALQYIVVDNPGQNPDGDLGNGAIGGKWRFLDEEQNVVSVSVAPAISFNTVQRSVDIGLVDRGVVFTLPVQVGKTVGPVDLYADVGRDFFESGTDLWFYGAAAEWPFHERWTVMGELYGIATYNFDADELLINGGLRFALRENLFLHGSAGVPIRKAETDPARLFAFLGVQWTF